LAKKTPQGWDWCSRTGAGKSPPFVELPVIFQGQGLQPDSPAAVIRKGDISIEITESATAGLIAKIMEAVAHAW